MRAPIRLVSCFLLLAVAPGCGDDDDDDDGGGAPDGGVQAGGTVVFETLSPPSGPLAGGTVVTVIGGGLDRGGTLVVVGETLATGVEVVNDQVLTFVVPPGVEPGPAAVTVFNAGGFMTREGAFVYNPPTTVTGLDPAFGPVEGGTSVDILGSGFVDHDPGVNMVLLDGAPVAFEVVDDTRLRITVPPGEALTARHVRVANRNGGGVARYGYTKPGLLVADGRGVAGSLFFLDPETGALEHLHDLPFPVTGLATAPDGTLFGIASSFPAEGGGPEQRLVTIDPFTGEIAERGVLQGAILPDITFEGSQLFGLDRNRGRLVAIDLETAALTEFPNDFDVGRSAIASDGTGTGRGFIIDSCTGCQLVRVRFEDSSAVFDQDFQDPESNDVMAAAVFQGELYALRKGTIGGELIAPPGGGQGVSLVKLDTDSFAVTTEHLYPAARFDALTHAPGSDAAAAE